MGKELSAHTVAALMVAQGVGSATLLTTNSPMRRDVLLFLLRKRAIDYWTHRDNRWLEVGSSPTELRLTDAGLQKVHNRVSGRAKAQSVTSDQVAQALAVIGGQSRNEPLEEFILETDIRSEGSGPEQMYPEEIENPKSYSEGTTLTVHVNRYERSAEARRACIAHYGARCSVCDLDFGERYGPRGDGFIHVHHLRPLANIGESYVVDPVAELRPVCPNCHAMLHARGEVLSIAALKEMLHSG